MTKADFDYDQKNDILYIFRDFITKGSLNIGDFNIDISHNGKLSGLEIMNASKTISKSIGTQITKKMLNGIKSAGINTENRGNAIYIYYAIFFATKEVKDFLPVPMPIAISH